MKNRAIAILKQDSNRNCRVSVGRISNSKSRRSGASQSPGASLISKKAASLDACLPAGADRRASEEEEEEEEEARISSDSQ